MRNLTALLCALTVLSGSACEKTKRVAIGGDDQIIVMADSLHWPALLFPLQTIFEKEYRVPTPEKEFYIQFVNLVNFDHYRNYKYVILAGTLTHKGPVSRFIGELLSDDAKEVVRSKEHFWFNKTDEWAYGQLMMILTSDSIVDLVDFINRNDDDIYERALEHKNRLVSDFIYTTGKYLEKKGLQKQLFEKYGWTMRIHPDYRLTDEQPEKGYVRFYAPSMNKSLQRWISVHWLPPAKDKSPDSVITEPWMTATRNKLGSWFVDTVVTVPMYDRYGRTEFAGYPALEYNGVWRTPSPVRPFGGAFRSFAFADSVTQRIYFIDLAVFFPEEQKKLKNLREQEIIARTFSVREAKE